MEGKMYGKEALRAKRVQGGRVSIPCDQEKGLAAQECGN